MATTFLDGPAQGVHLSLQRIPFFLRVTYCERTKTWDALDQTDDVPKPEEKLFVYVNKSLDGGAFVDGRDPKTGKRFGRFEMMATYAVRPEQPPDAEIRTAEGWTAWCEAQPEAERYKEKP